MTAYAISFLDMPLILLMTFFLVLVRTVPQMKLINGAWLQFVDLLPHFTRVHEVIRDAAAMEPPNGTRALPALEREITVDNATFGHAGAVDPVLEGINLTIGRNQTVALVGESGGGKTTLVDLLIRHHDPTHGRILVDGIDLREVNRADWNRLIGVVDQEAHLFHDTIADNIRFGNPTADDQAVRAAARLAHADGFISAMPDGYETVVGDRGTRLSGGQRQRIALARALVRDPQILILDEATSALDSESERLIQESIHSMAHKKTIILIAHRLSTVVNADKTVVIGRGRVLGEGTHVSLMRDNDTYRNLVTLQFGQDQVEEAEPD